MLSRSFLALSFFTALSFGLSGISAAYTSPQARPSAIVRSDGIYLRCGQCGTVEAIERNLVQGRTHGTAGAIIGAIAGGVLGNQIGRGTGRDVATIAGIVGGGFAGNTIGKKGGSGSNSWTLRVRMADGSYTNVVVPDASRIRTGDLVQVSSDGTVTPIR
jgi:outer membrane lipoprotein SlyB